jgi:aminoglycoside phosphotransferase family enzyme
LQWQGTPVMVSHLCWLLKHGGRHCCLLETTYTCLSLHVQVLDKYNHKIKIAGLDDMIQILEYAVKMWELPRQYPVDNMVVLGKTSLDNQKIDQFSFKFHRTTRTTAQIKSFGKPKFVR